MYISLFKLKNNFIMVFFHFLQGSWIISRWVLQLPLPCKCNHLGRPSGILWLAGHIPRCSLFEAASKSVSCAHQFLKYEILCIKSLKREPVLPTASGELSNSQRQVKPRVLPFYQGQRGHSVLLLQIIMDLLLCSSCNNVIN